MKVIKVERYTVMYCSHSALWSGFVAQVAPACIHYIIHVLKLLVIFHINRYLKSKGFRPLSDCAFFKFSWTLRGHSVSSFSSSIEQVSWLIAWSSCLQWINTKLSSCHALTTALDLHDCKWLSCLKLVNWCLSIVCNIFQICSTPAKDEIHHHLDG